MKRFQKYRAEWREMSSNDGFICVLGLIAIVLILIDFVATVIECI